MGCGSAALGGYCRRTTNILSGIWILFHDGLFQVTFLVFTRRDVKVKRLFIEMKADTTRSLSQTAYNDFEIQDVIGMKASDAERNRRGKEKISVEVDTDRQKKKMHSPQLSLMSYA